MAKTNATLLDTGDRLPELSFATPDSGDISAPACFEDGWGVLLLYRGRW
jgi:hypothetical protein